MARKESSAGKVQGNSLPEIRAGMKAAALRVAPKIPRPGRPIEEGPMLSRLAAWFLLLDDDDKIRIIREGHAVVEHLMSTDDPPGIFDGDVSVRIREEVFDGPPLVPAVSRADDALDGDEIPMVAAPRPTRKGAKPKQDRKRAKGLN